MQARIQFFCRSFNKALYLYSRGLYEATGYPCVRLTDQSADGYFATMLAHTDCDIAINVDEDCFLTDPAAAVRLAQKAAEEGWVNIGVSDASKGCPRSGNALVTNPFFNILNLAMIRHRLQEVDSLHAALARFRYEECRETLIADFRAWTPDLNTLQPDWKTSCTDLEPYYPFFLWLLHAFPRQTMYLTASRHADGLTTVLPFALHTWFARWFDASCLTRLFESNDLKEVNHSQRIRRVIEEAYAAQHLALPVFSTADRLGFAADSALRWAHKIPQRVARWPQKLLKRWQ